MNKFVWLFFLLSIPFSINASENNLEVYVLYNHENFIKNSPSYNVAWTLFEKAATKNNINLLLIYSSWNKSLKLLKSNKADSALLAFYTKERAKIMGFSVPVGLDAISIFKSKDSTLKDDFKNSTIGVQKGSIHTDLAKNKGFKYIYESTTRPELHRMLIAGRIDYILENESLVEYFCVHISDPKHCPTKVGLPLKKEPLYIVYNSKKPSVYNLFYKLNKYIYNERESVETKELFLNAGYSLEQYNTWKKVLIAHVNQYSF